MQVQSKCTCKVSQSRLRNIRIQEARNNKIHCYLRLTVTQCFTHRVQILSQEQYPRHWENCICFNYGSINETQHATLLNLTLAVKILKVKLAYNSSTKESKIRTSLYSQHQFSLPLMATKPHYKHARIP